MAQNAMEYFKKLREDHPEIQAEYDAQAPRFRALSALIRTRQEQQVSQAELARRMGVKQPVIAKLETGQDNVKLDTLARAAAALGCELDVSFKPMTAAKPWNDEMGEPGPGSRPGIAFPSHDNGTPQPVFVPRTSVKASATRAAANPRQARK